MKNTKGHIFLSAACIACFAMLAACAPPALAASKVAPLVSVEHLGVNPAVASIYAKVPRLFGDVGPSLSSSVLHGDPASEDAFLLRPQTALNLEFFTVENLSAQGHPLPGRSLIKRALNKGDVYLFRHHVPEGMPNLMVCAARERERHCWIPRFGGMDGDSLYLAPGFILFAND
jgi:hypothetical protein